MTYRSPTPVEAALFVGGVFLMTVAGGVLADTPGAIAGGLWVVATGWSYARAEMEPLADSEEAQA